MNKETIHIENLSIGYPGKGDVKVVADGICAGINSGELTCLLGANGVGKSTLLRTLSAFQPKLGGNIFIEGKEIGDYTDKQLSRVISVVLTEKCDIRNMSVVELIGLGRSPYTGFWGTLSKEDKTVVDKSIALVGIPHLAHRMVHTLSDGERQKVMIAKDEEYMAIPSVDVLIGQSTYADVVLKGFSKAIGIRFILDHFQMQDYLAFGDSLNDVEMLQHARIGVAMGNAHEEAKRAADIITRDVSEDGIYHALRQMRLLDL